MNPNYPMDLRTILAADPIMDYAIPSRYQMKFDRIEMPIIRSLQRGITCKEDMERLYEI